MNFQYQTNEPQYMSHVLVFKSKDSTASAILRSQPGEGGHGRVGVGVALQPNVDVRSLKWAAVKDRHIIVKVTTKTDITIKGDSLVAAHAGVSTFGVWPVPNTLEPQYASMYWNTGFPTQNVIEKQAYSATQTTTISESHFHSTTGTPLALENVHTGINAGVFVETSGAVTPTVREQASARVIVESIELTFVP